MRNYYGCSSSDSSKSSSPAVRLNASTGGAGPLPIITTLFADPLAVTSVTVSTAGMNEPAALLTFTSIISLPLGVLVTLNFELTRSFNGGAPVKVGSTYTFSTLVNILESESFAFQFFDSGLRAGHYTYSVQLSTNSIVDVTPGTTIGNATLSALVVDNDPE